nr:3171_t:CDS:2 [Entrophospora candida]
MIGKKTGLKSNNKNNKSKVNDILKVKASKVSSDSSENDEESTGESSSGSELDSKTKKILSATATSINDSDNSDDSSESESESNGKKRIKESSDSEDNEDSSDDSSESESESKITDSKVSGGVKNDKEESDSSSDNIKSTPQVVKRKINEEFSNSIKKPKIESDCKTVYVGELPLEVDDYTLQQEMKEAGYVVKARIMYDKFSKQSKGFAYVDFATPQEAQNALKLSGKKINGKAIVVRLDEKSNKNSSFQKPGGGSNFNKNLSEPSDTIFVGNLSFKADENQLDQLFNGFGKIVSIRLPTHPDTGSLKGFGYVQFSDINAAKNAMDLQGTVLAGRSIRLDYADTKQKKNNNNFGNAGGRNERNSSNRGKFNGSFGRGNGRNFGGNNRNNNVNSFSPASANRGAIVPGGGKKIVFDE